MSIKKGLLSSFGFLTICLLVISVSAVFIILELSQRFDITANEIKTALVSSKDLHKEIIALNAFIIRFNDTSTDLSKTHTDYQKTKSQIEQKFNTLKEHVQNNENIAHILMVFMKIDNKLFHYYQLRHNEINNQLLLQKKFNKSSKALADLIDLAIILAANSHSAVSHTMKSIHNLIDSAENDVLHKAMDRIIDVNLNDTKNTLNLKADLMHLKSLMEHIHISETEEDFSNLKQSIDTSLQSLTQNIKKTLNSKHRIAAEEIFIRLKKYLRKGSENILVERSNIVESQKLRSQIQSSLEADLLQIDQDMHKIINFYDAHLGKLTSETELAVEVGITIMIAITTIAFTFAVAITYLYIHKYILARLCHLARITMHLSQGNTDIPLPKAISDELGNMASALIIFRDNLIQQRKLQAQQEQLEKRLAEEKKQVNISLANQLEERISLIVGSLANASSSMKTATNHMVSASHTSEEQTNIVANSANNTAQNAEAVASASAEFSMSLNHLDEQVQNASLIAEKMSNRVQHTGQVISSLEEAAQKIEQIIYIIGDIAGQTNLLALNATIEAAQAGDVGKGFSIVASEVKSLANQTVQATENISLNVRNIQDITQKTVADISGLVTEIKDVNQMTALIAQAINEQNNANVEIDKNIRNTAEGIQNISESIQSVTDATKQSKYASNDLLNVATDIDKQSTNLNIELKGLLEHMRAA